MRIGYACHTVGVPDTGLKSCIMKNASEERLKGIIEHNLNALSNMIDYNMKNNIQLFRISSDLIPFGSNPVNRLPWWELFSRQFLSIGEKIKAGRMRVSMHPGQYTLLNSPNTEVVQRSMEDAVYHARVLDAFGLGPEHKIVLHIGGVYNDKQQAVRRFITNYAYLEKEVKQRLVLENDDKFYSIGDVFEIGMRLNIPVVFDNLHHQVNPPEEVRDDPCWIDACRETWKEEDGCPKIHYSQQNSGKKPGAHSNSIRIDEFLEFYQQLVHKDTDIMLEVKDKNLSALKCIYCTSADDTIQVLELEWSRYKYKILENAPSDYAGIRRLLRNKADYPAVAFYRLIEHALDQEVNKGNFINAALHVWGYFKDAAKDQERNIFYKRMEMYQQNQVSGQAIKNVLWKMTVKYQQPYLLNSYYFSL